MRILTCVLFSAAAVAAAPLTDVNEIVAKANLAAYYAGKDGRATVQMTLHDARGGERTRGFTILRYSPEPAGDQKFYVYFDEPADVRKMAYLVWKHTGARDDDRWLWLPALNLVKRIAPGDKRTSFVGSDFYYEDVSGRGLDEDLHELLETSDRHYVVRNTPKDPKSVEFASYTVWIDVVTLLPVKAEYVGADGQVYRRIEALKIETIGGFPTVTEARADDLKVGTYTINRFSDVAYDIGLQDRIFSERFLRRPPREVTR